MTAPAIEKAAPLPAEVLALAAEADASCQRDRCSRSDCNGFLCVRALEAVYAAQEARMLQDERASDLSDWSIDTSTGTDILVYKQCSVIEDDQAHLVMRMLRERLGGVTDEMVERAVTEYWAEGKQSNWHPNAPSGEAMRRILEAALATEDRR